jgi:solute carrier family 35 protein F1/2
MIDSGSNNESNNQPPTNTIAAIEASKPGRFSFLRSRQFYIVLLISQALAVAITGTNTLSSLLAQEGTSIPAFQTLFNYILLSLIYTSYTLYKYGFKGWCKLIYKDGWRYFILAFCDVEGNYFTVLAYRYTTILSAQLINFWAIAVVVAISMIFLKVRYHIAQYAGILICCGGLGLLVASDHISGSNGGQALNAVKGDLFALLGASLYGFTNVFEEFLVSKRPLYEVLGQLSFWAIPINGVQAAIFDRASFRSATWNSAVGGYLTGYTLILTIFYSGAPIVFRMASAAFFNIGLLTGNFWGVVVGIKVFGLHIHWLYPIAFVLIMVGHFVYFGTEGVLGEARKPWLGENQEGGSDGIGTAKRRVENPDAIV